VAESCRSIRTNLTFLASESSLDTLLITSPGPREGKTTSCLNMATVMAQSGTRVLLVDTDLRRPRVHTAFEGWHNDFGLSTMLTDGMAAVDVVRQSGIENLDVLTSGPVPPNPAELLESDRFREVIDELMQRYDRVVFDSPPVTPVTDAAILAGVMDGVVLVVRASSTSKEMMGRAVELLSAVNANLVGVVLNDVDLTRRRNGSYYYYYYRQYSQYYGEEQDAA
jgi:capsular exopolysaccharide synthesis family protein